MRALITAVAIFALFGVAHGGDQPEKKRKPKFTISKETTYVDGPVDKVGYVDYVSALNLRLGKGVTPDKNAFVLLLKAFGPKPEGSNMPAEFYHWLGVAAPPENGAYLIGLGKYVRECLNADAGELEEAFERAERAEQRPWKAKQHTVLAGWLKLNEKHINVAVEATKRPGYYHPLAPHRDAGLIAALLPSVQKCREFAQILALRAMLNLGEGRQEEAWQDLLACHRLGRHVAKGATLIEALVGIAVDSIASRGDVAFLGSAKLDAVQVKSCLKDLQDLPSMPAIADKVELCERFLFLDLIMRLDHQGIKALQGLAGFKLDEKTEKDLRDKVDWDPALKSANRWYDRMATAMRDPDRAKREKQLDQIDGELKKLKAMLADPDLLKKLIDDKTKPEVRGKLAGDFLIAMIVPAVRKVQMASDRSEQIQRNLHTAFALAAYQRDTDAYPIYLSALAPKYLDKVPGDLFTGTALTYRRTKDGYLLYSFGPNGKDDGGRYYDDDPPGDDPSVRMPLPLLKRK